MDHDDALVGKVFSRRDALTILSRAGLFLAGGSSLAAASALGREPNQNKQVHLVACPELTEGPFFVDEKLNRSDLTSGTKRSTVIEGLPLSLSFSVLQSVNGKVIPLQGAHVDVWHADAAGVYSDEANPMNHEDTSRQTWLRGYQVTDADGLVHFKTIFPGWYQGRCPHIHFKVRSFSASNKVTAEFTSQVFFHDHDAEGIYRAEPYASHGSGETTNALDGIFSQRQVDGTTAGSHLLLDLVKGAKDKEFHSQFAILLTPGNFKAGSSRRRGFGPGGPPPPPDGSGWG
jgi:protocatechuate 3,4-dioxygenase beta subunit